jgi:poly-gamma-glutamate capsule biosynthesis protein CapA/YwtB (metallophosphatase superfamily)
MTDIAHAAIDAGADVVMGHGPHYSLPVEAL